MELDNLGERKYKGEDLFNTENEKYTIQKAHACIIMAYLLEGQGGVEVPLNLTSLRAFLCTNFTTLPHLRAS